MKQLNREIRQIERRTLQGMVEGAELIRADAQRITPVDTGNLKNSAFVVWPRGGTGGGGSFRGEDSGRMSAEHSKAVADARRLAGSDGVVIGFSAYYAVYVHENEKAHHAGSGEAKFLEKAVRRNENKVVIVIKRRAEGA